MDDKESADQELISPNVPHSTSHPDNQTENPSKASPLDLFSFQQLQQPSFPNDTTITQPSPHPSNQLISNDPVYMPSTDPSAASNLQSLDANEQAILSPSDHHLPFTPKMSIVSDSNFATNGIEDGASLDNESLPFSPDPSPPDMIPGSQDIMENGDMEADDLNDMDNDIDFAQTMQDDTYLPPEQNLSDTPIPINTSLPLDDDFAGPAGSDPTSEAVPSSFPISTFPTSTFPNFMANQPINFSAASLGLSGIALPATMTRPNMFPNSMPAGPSFAHFATGLSTSYQPHPSYPVHNMVSGIPIPSFPPSVPATSTAIDPHIPQNAPMEMSTKEPVDMDILGDTTAPSPKPAAPELPSSVDSPAAVDSLLESTHITSKDAQPVKQEIIEEETPSDAVVPTRDPALLWEKTLDVYLNREKAYGDALKQQMLRQRQLMEAKSKEVDYLRRRYAQELDRSHPPFELVISRKRKRADDFTFTDEQLAEIADKQEALVPIRLDLEVEGIKLRDTFTWNLNETLVQPEQFAVLMCEDLNLPAALFVPAIVRAIKEQVDDYYQHAPSALHLAEVDSRGNGGVDNADKDGPELRTVIKLDITVGNYTLVDQFEWDLNCKRNSPEAFAEHMCNELALGMEFKTAIAHQIREQVQTFAKSLLLVDHHFDGQPIDDDELAGCFLPPIDPAEILRTPKAKALFGPYYNPVTDLEIERMEKDRERDARRKRRQTQRSRRAIALPDREALKTNRTGPFIPNPPDPLETVVPPHPGPATRRNAPRRTRGATETLVNTPPVVKEKEPQAPASITEVALSRDWRCENCGVDAKETPLLRKGPNGDKTLCNSCGLFYHRNNRQRPVSRPPSAIAVPSPQKLSKSPARPQGLQVSIPPRKAEQQQSPTEPMEKEKLPPTSPLAPSSSVGPPSSQPSSAHPHRASQHLRIPIPAWLTTCKEALMRKYPHDTFDVVPKGKTGELRLKCFDCPGKLYQTGPSETLNNFEIHLKNRHHRAAVNERLAKQQGLTREPTDTAWNK